VTDFPSPLNPETFLIRSLKYLGEDDEQGLLLYLTQHLKTYESIFADFLVQWFRDFCDRFPPESQLEIAQALAQLGRLIQSLITPFNNDRYHICLICYELALSQITQTTYPVNWAMLQRQLGKLHLLHTIPDLTSHFSSSDSCSSNRNGASCTFSEEANGDAIEKAIVAYQNALQVFTREAFPHEWAVLQNDLGGAYLKRLQGDRQNNLDTALQCYRGSLEVFDRENTPEDWAGSQNNLGNYYRERLRGDRSHNLETAINCYHQALTVLTREAHPLAWAGIQMNLGDCYRDRLIHDRHENLSIAINYYLAALQVYNREQWEEQWTLTHIKLEEALRDRQNLANQLPLTQVLKRLWAS